MKNVMTTIFTINECIVMCFDYVLVINKVIDTIEVFSFCIFLWILYKYCAKKKLN